MKSRLRGRLPFDAHNVDDILKNTLKMPLPLDEEHWDNVSPDCKILFPSKKFFNIFNRPRSSYKIIG